MVAAILLATALLFAALCAALLFRDRGREKAFRDFLDTPDEYHEKLLVKTVSGAQADALHLLALLLREKQEAYDELQMRLADYEEYVEAWAHETKMPVSLLSLLLDNRREELPEPVGAKLDYVQSRMQECIDQMLFYARVKGMRKDYLFERCSVCAHMEEVLEDYRPLLEEKRFRIERPAEDSMIYTDRRAFRFLLQQVVGNAVKYGGEEPKICFGMAMGEGVGILWIRDNGIGVRSCDLPFIFEKGFTGNCGDDRKKATGMGLYLAAEIAKDLKLSLEADSVWGEGFEMRIAFPLVGEGR